VPVKGNIQPRIAVAPGPGSCLLYSHGRVSPISRFPANRGPVKPRARFPPLAESGNGVGKRGFPPRFPAKWESESGERELGTFGSASGSVCQCVVRMGGSSWTTITPMIVA
jgi:hypothetical protein